MKNEIEKELEDTITTMVLPIKKQEMKYLDRLLLNLNIYDYKSQLEKLSFKSFISLTSKKLQEMDIEGEAVDTLLKAIEFVKSLVTAIEQAKSTTNDLSNDLENLNTVLPFDRQFVLLHDIPTKLVEALTVVFKRIRKSKMSDKMSHTAKFFLLCVKCNIKYAHYFSASGLEKIKNWCKSFSRYENSLPANIKSSVGSVKIKDSQMVSECDQLWLFDKWITLLDLSEHINLFKGLTYNSLFTLNENILSLVDLPQEKANRLLEAVHELKKVEDILNDVRDLNIVDGVDRLLTVSPTDQRILLGPLSTQFIEVMHEVCWRLNFEENSETDNSRSKYLSLCLTCQCEYSDFFSCHDLIKIRFCGKEIQPYTNICNKNVRYLKNSFEEIFNYLKPAKSFKSSRSPMLGKYNQNLDKWLELKGLKDYKKFFSSVSYNKLFSLDENSIARFGLSKTEFKNILPALKELKHQDETILSAIEWIYIGKDVIEALNALFLLIPEELGDPLLLLYPLAKNFVKAMSIIKKHFPALPHESRCIASSHFTSIHLRFSYEYPNMCDFKEMNEVVEWLKRASTENYEDSSSKSGEFWGFNDWLASIQMAKYKYYFTGLPFEGLFTLKQEQFVECSVDEPEVATKMYEAVLKLRDMKHIIFNAKKKVVNENNTLAAVNILEGLLPSNPRQKFILVDKLSVQFVKALNLVKDSIMSSKSKIDSVVRKFMHLSMTCQVRHLTTFMPREQDIIETIINDLESIFFTQPIDIVNFDIWLHLLNINEYKYSFYGLTLEDFLNLGEDKLQELDISKEVVSLILDSINILKGHFETIKSAEEIVTSKLEMSEALKNMKDLLPSASKPSFVFFGTLSFQFVEVIKLALLRLKNSSPSLSEVKELLDLCAHCRNNCNELFSDDDLNLIEVCIEELESLLLISVTVETDVGLEIWGFRRWLTQLDVGAYKSFFADIPFEGFFKLNKKMLSNLKVPKDVIEKVYKSFNEIKKQKQTICNAKKCVESTRKDIEQALDKLESILPQSLSEEFILVGENAGIYVNVLQLIKTCLKSSKNVNAIASQRFVELCDTIEHKYPYTFMVKDLTLIKRWKTLILETSTCHSEVRGLDKWLESNSLVEYKNHFEYLTFNTILEINKRYLVKLKISSQLHPKILNAIEKLKEQNKILKQAKIAANTKGNTLKCIELLENVLLLDSRYNLVLLGDISSQFFQVINLVCEKLNFKEPLEDAARNFLSFCKNFEQLYSYAFPCEDIESLRACINHFSTENQSFNKIWAFDSWLENLQLTRYKNLFKGFDFKYFLGIQRKYFENFSIPECVTDSFMDALKKIKIQKTILDDAKSGLVNSANVVGAVIKLASLIPKDKSEKFILVGTLSCQFSEVVALVKDNIEKLKEHQQIYSRFLNICRQCETELKDSFQPQRIIVIKVDTDSTNTERKESNIFGFDNWINHLKITQYRHHFVDLSFDSLVKLDEVTLEEFELPEKVVSVVFDSLKAQLAYKETLIEAKNLAKKKRQTLVALFQLEGILPRSGAEKFILLGDLPSFFIEALIMAYNQLKTITSSKDWLNVASTFSNICIVLEVDFRTTFMPYQIEKVSLLNKHVLSQLEKHSLPLVPILLKRAAIREIERREAQEKGLWNLEKWLSVSKIFQYKHIFRNFSVEDIIALTKKKIGHFKLPESDCEQILKVANMLKVKKMILVEAKRAVTKENNLIKCISLLEPLCSSVETQRFVLIGPLIDDFVNILENLFDKIKKMTPLEENLVLPKFILICLRCLYGINSAFLLKHLNIMQEWTNECETYLIKNETYSALVYSWSFEQWIANNNLSKNRSFYGILTFESLISLNTKILIDFGYSQEEAKIIFEPIKEIQVRYKLLTDAKHLISTKKDILNSINKLREILFSNNSEEVILVGRLYDDFIETIFRVKQCFKTIHCYENEFVIQKFVDICELCEEKYDSVFKLEDIQNISIWKNEISCYLFDGTKSGEVWALDKWLDYFDILKHKQFFKSLSYKKYFVIDPNNFKKMSISSEDIPKILNAVKLLQSQRKTIAEAHNLLLSEKNVIGAINKLKEMFPSGSLTELILLGKLSSDFAEIVAFAHKIFNECSDEIQKSIYSQCLAFCSKCIDRYSMTFVPAELQVIEHWESQLKSYNVQQSDSRMIKDVWAFDEWLNYNGLTEYKKFIENIEYQEFFETNSKQLRTLDFPKNGAFRLFEAVVTLKFQKRLIVEARQLLLSESDVCKPLGKLCRLLPHEPQQFILLGKLSTDFFETLTLVYNKLTTSLEHPGLASFIALCQACENNNTLIPKDLETLKTWKSRWADKEIVIQEKECIWAFDQWINAENLRDCKPFLEDLTFAEIMNCNKTNENLNIPDFAVSKVLEAVKKLKTYQKCLQQATEYVKKLKNIFMASEKLNSIFLKCKKRPMVLLGDLSNQFVKTLEIITTALKYENSFNSDPIVSQLSQICLTCVNVHYKTFKESELAIIRLCNNSLVSNPCSPEIFASQTWAFNEWAETFDLQHLHYIFEKMTFKSLIMLNEVKIAKYDFPKETINTVLDAFTKLKDIQRTMYEANYEVPTNISASLDKMEVILRNRKTKKLVLPGCLSVQLVGVLETIFDQTDKILVVKRTAAYLHVFYLCIRCINDFYYTFRLNELVRLIKLIKKIENVLPVANSTHLEKMWALEKWLESIKLSRYLYVFKYLTYDSMIVLLTEKEILKEFKLPPEIEKTLIEEIQVIKRDDQLLTEIAEKILKCYDTVPILNKLKNIISPNNKILVGTLAESFVDNIAQIGGFIYDQGLVAEYSVIEKYNQMCLYCEKKSHLFEPEEMEIIRTWHKKVLEIKQ